MFVCSHQAASFARTFVALGDSICCPSAAVRVGHRARRDRVHATRFAFTRCGELNLNGMVEAQIAVFESELLADTLVS